MSAQNTCPSCFGPISLNRGRYEVTLWVAENGDGYGYARADRKVTVCGSACAIASLRRWNNDVPGARVEDGGEMGTLMTCDTCSGNGLLHCPDTHPEPVKPSVDTT